MKVTQKWTKIAVLVAALSFAFSGCGKNNPTASEGDQQTILPSVEVTCIEPTTIQAYKTLSSNILAKDTISIVPKVSGVVKKVYVKVGDEVQAGDILFEIDSSDIELQIQSSKASVASADASIHSAKAGLNSALANKEMNTGSNIEKQILSLENSIKTAELQHKDLVKQLDVTRSLYEAGGASEADVEKLETQVENSQSNIELSKENLKLLKEKTLLEMTRVSDASINQAKASINQAQASKQQAETGLANSKKQLSNTKVVAEVSGIVSSCNVTEGAMASSTSPAITLVNIDQVKIGFNVTDDLINKMKVGSRVYTSIKSLKDQEFKGTISVSSPSADSKTMLYPIEVLIDNPKHLLKPGMFATSRIILDEKSNTISLPIDAVIQKDDEKYVFTIDAENTAHKVLVETGIENDTAIEILSGLNFNDNVVVKGQDYIEDDSKVNVLPAQQQ